MTYEHLIYEIDDESICWITLNAWVLFRSRSPGGREQSLSSLLPASGP